ncbi:MAG: serine/threonine protein phosphatase [Oscillospiraceae bacterium]|jgi:hypothetical protein|nr:serine/threonine protein phosphatase [Oscillospiraceae bacterium]
MKLPWNKPRQDAAAVSVQLRETGSGAALGLPAAGRAGDRGEIALYRAIREAVPLVDAALLKIIRLAGGFRAACPDPGEEAALNDFLEAVPVGRGQYGVQVFLDAYLDSLLTCGRAVGEMVADREGGRLAALLCGDARDISFLEGASPLDTRLALRAPDGTLKPLPRQDLLLFTPYNPEPDAPYGVSLLRGLPFLADILMNIYRTVGRNWERVGNARIAVVCKPDPAEGGSAAERAAQIAGAWSAAMQNTPGGRVRDFVAVGDVDIRVIGADNQTLDSQVPVRQLVEQLIARTGIPPFMLGLNWSSTERMSSQQADLMTSELTALRRTVTPALTRVLRFWQTLEGRAPTARVAWEVINLQDEVEEARAALFRAQAEHLNKGV